MNKPILAGMLVVQAIVFSAHADDSHFKFSSGLPSNQKQQFLKDMEYLKTVPSVALDGEVQKVMKLNSWDGASLDAWLKERFKYVIEESFKLDESSIRIISPSYRYPNPDSLPDVERGPKKPGDDNNGGKKVSMAAANIGGAVYMIGKQMKALLGIAIPGVGNVSVKSPRTGIVQIGDVLVNKPESYQLSEVGSTQMNLEIYFHEARHSDGNSKSLVFAHAVCPAGHTFEGFNACDRNQNGPYKVGALVLRELTKTCQDCSAKDKEVLKVVTLDSLDRLLPDTQDWDDAPEGAR